jgi:aldose 1-epimerase
MTGYTTTSSELDGLETIELRAPGPDGLTAAFAPGANLVLHSLKRGDHELLAVNDGLRAYRDRGATMGIPLLHPWANRLSGSAYAVAGTRVDLPRDTPLTDRDHNGLPIHGALPGLLRWDVLETTAGEDLACLRAELQWEPEHEAFPIFPFPHRLEYEAVLRSQTIEITVALAPTGDAPVPVSFGFHPYLRIPGGSRASARLALPVRRQLLHDDTMIPTGESVSFEPGTRPLGHTEWDDGFADLVPPAQFLVSDGERDVSLSFLGGYPFAQVYAPPGSDFVCFEPMTAPANALVRGGPDLKAVAPGETYRAAFEVLIAPVNTP